MLQATSSAGPGRALFDMRVIRELGRASKGKRVGAALLFAALTATLLPWPVPLTWLALVVAWEAAAGRVLDRHVMRMPDDRALTAYSAMNFVGSSLFSVMALLALRDGSALGVAFGVAWLSGSFTNNFVYYGGAPRLLYSSLAPAVATAVAGPLAAYGFGLKSCAVTGMILFGLMAARAYALDHRTVLGRLSDRQVALVDLERKLAIAIDAAGDGLFEVDAEGRYTLDANFMAMLGYAPGDLAMPLSDWRDMVHPEDVPLLEVAYAEHFAQNTPHTTNEIRMLRKDGAYTWILSRGKVVERDADGLMSRIMGTGIDISQRKALERELEATRDQALGASKAKDVFVANMSHEIRTPLNGVIGMAGALAKTRLDAPQREMVGLIESSGLVLDRLLTDILDQAKIEAGEFELQAAPFDLRRELDSSVELMRARADEKGLAFALDCSEAASGTFEGDAVRLRQVVSNLASNAIKFTERGEVRIAVDAQHAAAMSWVTITVTDTGIGIAPETAGRLFQRFSQADGTISRRFGGTGLGLAISRALVELMGGEISVTSELGLGSAFTVCVPLRPLAAIVAEDDAEDAALAVEGLRILLAEDHPTNQKVVQLILAPHGVELQIVGDGQAALEAFASGAWDCVLMDMQMPVMDGVAAVAAIRAREAAAGAPRTPIAMLTANASDEHRTLGLEAGADAHIAKPITPESLLLGIAALMTPARETSRRDVAQHLPPRLRRATARRLGPGGRPG